MNYQILMARFLCKVSSENNFLFAILDPSKPDILTNYTAAHDAITFSWRSPNRPNGIISSYSIKLYTREGLIKNLTIIKYFPLKEIHTISIKDLEAEKRYEIVVRQTDRQPNRQTAKQTDRQTDRCENKKQRAYYYF